MLNIIVNSDASQNDETFLGVIEFCWNYLCIFKSSSIAFSQVPAKYFSFSYN